MQDTTICVCTTCGYIGPSDRSLIADPVQRSVLRTVGDILMGCVCWLLPWFASSAASALVTAAREADDPAVEALEHRVCPKCHQADAMLPLDTPLAREYIKRVSVAPHPPASHPPAAASASAAGAVRSRQR